jgi:O-antigen/teichoic acid export membrane protein
MSGYPRLNFLNSLFVLGMNIALDLFLISRFGVMGAALAGGLSLLAVNIIRLLEVHVILKMHPYSLSYWKPLVAGLVAALSTTMLGGFLPAKLHLPGVLILSCLLVLVYGSVLALLRLDEADRVVLLALRRKVRAWAGCRNRDVG